MNCNSRWSVWCISWTVFTINLTLFLLANSCYFIYHIEYGDSPLSGRKVTRSIGAIHDPFLSYRPKNGEVDNKSPIETSVNKKSNQIRAAQVLWTSFAVQSPTIWWLSANWAHISAQQCQWSTRPAHLNGAPYIFRFLLDVNGSLSMCCRYLGFGHRYGLALHLSS